MFKQLQESPFIKSLQSCLGTIMKRSSTSLASRLSNSATSLASGFARPASPPSRSLCEPVGLDASVTTREAGKPAPEPTEPSKLPGPPIAVPDPIPKPPATSSSSRSKQPLAHIPEPTLAAAAAPLCRTEAEHPDEALRQSEYSSRTGSQGQVFTHKYQLPNEFHTAPWHSDLLVTERSSQLEQEALAEPKAASSISRPNPVPTDQVSTTLSATEGPPASEDNVSNADTTIPWQNKSLTFD